MLYIFINLDKVVWRKKQAKKHKTWDGDGILSVSNSTAVLKDENGKDLGKMTSSIFDTVLGEGAEFSIGGKDVEITSVVNEADFTSGSNLI